MKDNNKEVNYLNDNNKDGTQYVITVYLFNKSFMHFLII